MIYSRTFNCFVDYIDPSNDKCRILMNESNGLRMDVAARHCKKITKGLYLLLRALD